jgi:hypothetical protein
MKCSDKTTYRLLWITAILFVVFLVVMSLHVRIGGDDLFLLSNLKKEGWFNSVYLFKTGVRWSSFLLFNTIFLFNNEIQNLGTNIFIYYLFTFTLLLTSLSYLINVIIKRITKVVCPYSLCLLIAILISAVLFFATSEYIEVWFALSATPIYLIPTLFFILGIAAIFSYKNNIITYFFIIFSFLYIGGAVETFALIVLFILGFLLLLAFKKDDGYSLKSIRNKLITALLFTSIFIFINLTGHGIVERFAHETTVSKYSNQKEIERIMNAILEVRNVVVITFLVMLIMIGKILKDKEILLPFIKLKTYLFYNFLFISFVTAFTFIPIILTFHSLGPKRSWYPFNFFLVLSLSFIAIYIGYIYAEKISKFKWLMQLIPVLGGVLIGIYFYKQYPLVTNFSKKYDQRIDYLLHLKELKNKKEIGLQPLPDSGLMGSAEISVERNGKENVGLKLLLNLDFEIYLIEPKTNTNIKPKKAY